MRIKTTFLSVVLLWFLPVTASGQNKHHSYHHQLTIISENDVYALRYSDRYYTNGLMVRFSKVLSDKSPAFAAKRILMMEAGQHIFTPYKYDIRSARHPDRPFTGILYLKGGISYITPKENVLRWSITGGVTGRAAGGKEVQRTYHKCFNFPKVYGWETQLNSGIGINLQGEYYHHLSMLKKNKRWLDAHAKLELLAGTIYTQASTGLLIKTGAFESAANSALWEAHLAPGDNRKKPKKELFFYMEPQLTCQVFNATIQGGLFTDQQNKFTTQTKRFVYSHRFGIACAQNRYTLQAGYTYKTKEALTQRTNEYYGTIALGYRFH